MQARARIDKENVQQWADSGCEFDVAQMLKFAPFYGQQRT